MTTATASIVVVALFGFLIGVILQVVIQIIPRFRETGNASAETPATEKGMVRQLVREGAAQADAPRAQVQAISHSQLFAILVFYALIAMLVLVIRLSPVRMNWGVLFGSVFVGFVIADFVFWLARTNRIGTSSPAPDRVG